MINYAIALFFSLNTKSSNVIQKFKYYLFQTFRIKVQFFLENVFVIMKGDVLLGKSDLRGCFQRTSFEDKNLSEFLIVIKTYL